MMQQNTDPKQKQIYNKGTEKENNQEVAVVQSKSRPQLDSRLWRDFLRAETACKH